VVLGTTSKPGHQVLRLGRGAIIELDTAETDDVKVLANDLPVAKGAVVVNGNRIAVEVTELLPRSPELRRRLQRYGYGFERVTAGLVRP